MDEPVLSVAQLQKRVRGRTLVKNVSFDVFPGEVFGFLGPNGAGKTTTIRMLVGLVKPTSGRIFVNGHNLKSHPAKAMKTVGCIVENPDLYPYLTGYENLLQLARMQGRAAVRRIDTVAAMVRLSDRLFDKVRTYSLGMRQRLGIAQALLCNPKLLILDEPTNGLDPSGIRELRAFLKDLATQGMAIFVSSHLLAEIEQLCDKVAIIQNGAMVQTGSVEEFLRASSLMDWRIAPMDTAHAILSQYAEDVLRIHDKLRCTMTDDAVAAAIPALSAAGCKIYEVSRLRVSLEDVFLQTTEGGPRNDVAPSDLE